MANSSKKLGKAFFHLVLIKILKAFFICHDLFRAFPQKKRFVGEKRKSLYFNDVY